LNESILASFNAILVKNPFEMTPDTILYCRTLEDEPKRIKQLVSHTRTRIAGTARLKRMIVNIDAFQWIARVKHSAGGI